MKDKKFVILCVLVAIWLLIFVGMLAGVEEVTPKIQEFLAAIILGWFAFWTISVVRNKPKNASAPGPETNKSEPNQRN